MRAAATPAPTSLLRRALPAVVSALICLALAMWAVLPALRHGFATTTNCNCADVDLEQWFLAWDAHAVSQGHSPLITHAINAPYVVNLMWNTSLILPGVLFAPLTRWQGPLATYNTLLVLGLAGSAFTATCVLRRWARWWPAALAGGLAYGFSPYAIAAGVTGHLHLSLAFVPPLLLATLDDVFVRRTRRHGVLGLQLGLLLTCQLLISEEVLAQVGLMTGIVGLVLLVTHRRESAPLITGALPTALWGAVVFAVTAGPFLVVQFFGPGRVHGPAQPIDHLNAFSADLLSPVLPVGNQAIDPSFATGISQHFTEGYGGEQSSYLGPSLLLVMVVSLLCLRRLQVVRTFGLVAGVAFVLSLGPELVVGNRSTGVPLPLAALRHVPLASSLIAARFSTIVALAAGALLAVSSDRARSRIRRRAQQRPVVRRVGSLIGLAELGAALVPLWPSLPLPAAAVEVPAYFLAAPAAGTAFTYPYARNNTAQPMIWQALADFRFSLTGGYVLVPDQLGHGSFEADDVHIKDVLVQLHDQHVPLPPMTPGDDNAARSELCIHGIDTVFVKAGDFGAPTAVGLFTRLAGRPPDPPSGGIYAWSNLNFCPPA